jgi:REP element-mobilizing transposase RayT
MGRKYAIRDQQAIYFVTFTLINWIDLFIRDSYREVFIESLGYCQRHKGLQVHAYCIMTSHIHLILSANDGYNLSSIIRDLKSYTSFKLGQVIKTTKESRREWMLLIMNAGGLKNQRNKGFQLWQQHNHPIELRTVEMTNQRLNYIHNNPVAAGFVDDPTAWTWSSSAAYELGSTGKVQLVFLT